MGDATASTNHMLPPGEGTDPLSRIAGELGETAKRRIFYTVCFSISGSYVIPILLITNDNREELERRVELTLSTEKKFL